jgi:hypothetical protein
LYQVHYFYRYLLGTKFEEKKLEVLQGIFITLRRRCASKSVPREEPLEASTKLECDGN